MNLKRLKIFMSIFASAAFVLSVAHHNFNFWGLEIIQEAGIVLTAVPLFAFLGFLLLDRIWHLCAAIEKKRWLLFIFPALLTAAVLAWQYYKAPTIWHTIKIVPAAGQTGPIELYEIKYPPGKIVKFWKVAETKGWNLEGDILKTSSANPAPFEHSFLSPIGETTTLLLQRSPASRDITVTLDGKPLDVKLRYQTPGLTTVEMNTEYKMGIPAGIVLALVIVSDFLVFFLLILFAWVAQEISQLKPAQESSEEKFLSHRASVAILLTLTAILHGINFLTTPLVIGPDSPGFMVGSIHWIENYNLEGVLPGRGPITTFLFIPAFLIFVRDRWGVKLTLHLLALVSAPIAYYLGWNLYKRRAYAFLIGVIVMLMPEMYLYSNIVMSDMPNMFLILAYCALLIPALERFSWKSVSISLLAGAVAALHRPENILPFIFGAGFFFLKIIWERKDMRGRFQILGTALLIAALPLLLWSAYNKKVHGFFGLFDYAIANSIWYDGWIYYGEASGIQITDHNAPAVKIIDAAIKAYDEPFYYQHPTGGELYPVLQKYGYTKPEARKILGDAAKDSIRNNPDLAFELYLVKLRKSFYPEYVVTTTFTMPGEQPSAEVVGQWEAENFDPERNVAPALIPLQRLAYKALGYANPYAYRPLVLFSLCVALLAVYQKQFFKWTPLIAIAVSRLFITITMGLASWRYMLSGILILLICSALAIQTTQRFFATLALNPKPE